MVSLLRQVQFPKTSQQGEFKRIPAPGKAQAVQPLDRLRRFDLTEPELQLGLGQGGAGPVIAVGSPRDLAIIGQSGIESTGQFIVTTREIKNLRLGHIGLGLHHFKETLSGGLVGRGQRRFHANLCKVRFQNGGILFAAGGHAGA